MLALHEQQQCARINEEYIICLKYLQCLQQAFYILQSYKVNNKKITIMHTMKNIYISRKKVMSYEVYNKHL